LSSVFSLKFDFLTWAVKLYSLSVHAHSMTEKNVLSSKWLALWVWNELTDYGSGEAAGVTDVSVTHDAGTDTSLVQSTTSALELTNDCSLLSVAGTSLFSSPEKQSFKPRWIVRWFSILFYYCYWCNRGPKYEGFHVLWPYGVFSKSHWCVTRSIIMVSTVHSCSHHRLVTLSLNQSFSLSHSFCQLIVH